MKYIVLVKRDVIPVIFGFSVYSDLVNTSELTINLKDFYLSDKDENWKLLINYELIFKCVKLVYPCASDLFWSYRNTIIDQEDNNFPSKSGYSLYGHLKTFPYKFTGQKIISSFDQAQKDFLQIGCNKIYELEV